MLRRMGKQLDLFAPKKPPAERSAEHLCHARGCTRKVPPERLTCRDHWFLIPKKIRDAVWAAYREGQCDDMEPSKEWMLAAEAAIGFLARREGRPMSPNEVEALSSFGYPAA